jgi:hypothetical protein
MGYNLLLTTTDTGIAPVIIQYPLRGQSGLTAYRNLPIGRIAIPKEPSTIFVHGITSALVGCTIKVDIDSANLSVTLEEVGPVWVIETVLK